MRKKAYGRILYVEPNDIVSSNGESIPLDNVSWNPEDLNMAVDLQVIVPRRSDFGSRNLNTGAKSTIEIWHEGLDDVGRYISFMQGADIKDKNRNLIGHELTTDYINASYTEVTSQGQSCKEALGIDSIDITFDQHFYPQVSIKFIDVRGYSLMMPTEEVYRLEHVDAGSSRLSSGGYINFFRALFHFPYPRFLLTVKGFYGRSITFQLAVNEFRNNFNSDTGNFEITVSFIGYMYGLYTDIPLNLLIAAPYCDEMNGSTDGKKSSLWEGNANFTYDDGAGRSAGKIQTFIEFMDSCNNLNEAIVKSKGTTSQYEALGKSNQNSAKLNALDSIKSKLKYFVEQTKKKYNDRSDDKESYIYTEDGFDAIWFKVDDDENAKGIEVDFDAWNSFAAAWNGYNRDDNLGTPIWQPQGNLSKENVYYDNVPRPDNYNGEPYYNMPFYNRVETDEKGQKHYFMNTVSEGGITISYLKENGYDDLHEKIVNSKYSTKRVYYIMGSVIAKMVDKRMEELREEQKEIAPVAKDELAQLYNENLGFNPSVLNIYRMIFAHVDCFMNLFYNVAKEITDNPESRKLENFGVPKDRMDMSPYMSGSALVPPYPAIYKEEADGRRVQIYPEKDLWDKMPEVRFVEALINGTLGLKDRARKIISEQKERNKFNQENESASADASYNYLPTAITDFMHRSNPYYSVPSGDVNHVMECIFDRIISAYIQQGYSMESMSGIGEIEAENFISLHKETVVDSFKHELSSKVDELGSSNEATRLNPVKSFIQYWNKQNKDYEMTFTNGEIKINNKNLPVYSSVYPSKKGNSVLVDDDNYVPLVSTTFNMFSRSQSEYNNFTNFVNSIENGVKPDVDYGSFKDMFLTNDVSTWIGLKSLKRISNEDPICKINNYKKDIIYIDASGVNFNDDIYKLGDEKPSLVNKAGGLFLSDTYKKYSMKMQAAIFLIHLNGVMYGLTSSSENYIDIIIPDLTMSGIHTMKSATAYLLCAAVSIGIKDSNICSGVGTKMRFIIGNNESKLTPDVSNKICRRMFSDRSNTKTDLFDNLKTKFDSFIKGEVWKKIYHAITSKDSYNEPIETLGTKWWGLKDSVKKLIYDEMISPNSDTSIYVVNSENVDKSVGISSSEFNISLDVFNNVLRTMQSTYGTTTTEYERTDPKFSKENVTNDHRLALYNALKNLYDKWANSYTYENFILRSPDQDKLIKKYRYQFGQEIGDRCEFDNFLFVDCFYNDISNKFRINPGILSELICKHVQADSNYSIYECMSEIMQKNKMLLQALPVNSNFYEFGTIQEIFTPKLVDETMRIGFGATYVGMYTYEVSHVVEDERFDDHLDKDYFMIADLNGITDDPTPTKIGEAVFAIPDPKNGDLSIPVPAFGVTYARQNQSYFKRIDVNMDNPRITDYSLYNLFALTNSINENEFNRPLTVASDIYSIYANRSYNCSVEMMGCANIMPMMYFQLNNIPMFRGAYMISNVEHHISAGDFTTKFSGVRISKNQLPYNADIFDCNNGFDFSSTEGGVYGLTESPVSYNENNNSINNGIRVNYPPCENCIGWDVNAAIAMMEVRKVYKINGTCHTIQEGYKTLFTPSSSGIIPAQNTKSYHCCASAVKTFMRAGFLSVANDSSRSEIEKKWAQDSCNYIMSVAQNGNHFHTSKAEANMAKIGFKHIYTTTSTTKSGVDEELKHISYNGKTGLQPGDIGVMIYNGNSGAGHIQMYRGDGYSLPWVSDFAAQHAYVKKDVTKGDVWIYRFVGSRDLNNKVETAKNNTNNNGAYPKGRTFTVNGGDEPHYPYRIFNINRNATAAKNLSKSLSRITSYNSLTADEKSGKKGEANRISTTHQDAQGACNLFIYYVKKQYIDNPKIGYCSIEYYVNMYKTGKTTLQNESKQYIADACLYLSKRLGREITPQSKLEWNEPFICALGEIQARIEQGIKVAAYMHAAWNNVHNIS